MTAVPKRVIQLVDERDEYRCQRCAMSLRVISGSRHHRLRRLDGGHSVSNLILLCGSGTTGCHGWAHSHPKTARAYGYIIPALGRITPEDVPSLPVFTYWGWELRDDRGHRQQITEADAAELMALYGVSD